MTTLLFCLILAAAILLAEPLWVLIGGATVASYFLWGGASGINAFDGMMERIRGLVNQQVLLAIPFFLVSGEVMAKGQISQRLINFAKALLGWLPGGLAVSGIGACLLFAAITGSSTATLAAIGGLVYPALVREKYRDDFSLGLVTTAGSIGILVPPSIPMIIYCLFNTGARLEVERLWLGGIGPALLIAACLGIYSMIAAVRQGVPRTPFSFKTLRHATRDGFWALLLPTIILGGIYSGLFTAVEAAAVAAIYALLVEVYFHRSLTWKQVPELLAGTMTLLGSFMIIIVMAMGLADFLESEKIPEAAAAWIGGMHLGKLGFLVALNLLLLIVGCLLDILSALMILVPLIAPMAAQLGIDPVHLGIVFIVNLEIGYLTPPVGLNLFLSATMFNRTFPEMVKVTAPFVLLMLVCMTIVTAVPGVSTQIVDLVYGKPAPAVHEVAKPQPGKVKSIKELTDDAAGEAAGGTKKVKSIKELTDEAAEEAK